jgi:hypothetical protein
MGTIGNRARQSFNIQAASTRTEAGLTILLSFPKDVLKHMEESNIDIDVGGRIVFEVGDVK